MQLLPVQEPDRVIAILLERNHAQHEKQGPANTKQFLDTVLVTRKGQAYWLACTHLHARGWQPTAALRSDVDQSPYPTDCCSKVM